MPTSAANCPPISSSSAQRPSMMGMLKVKSAGRSISREAFMPGGDISVFGVMVRRRRRRARGDTQARQQAVNPLKQKRTVESWVTPSIDRAEVILWSAQKSSNMVKPESPLREGRFGGVCGRAGVVGQLHNSCECEDLQQDWVISLEIIDHDVADETFRQLAGECSHIRGIHSWQSPGQVLQLSRDGVQRRQ